MADTAKDFLRERIEGFKQAGANDLRLANEMKDRAAKYERSASECRKAIVDFEAALVKLGELSPVGAFEIDMRQREANAKRRPNNGSSR